jgi:hypothetical protein
VDQVPQGLIEGTQPLKLEGNYSDARETLSAYDFGLLIDADTNRRATYECTEDNARRAKLLAEYADHVRKIEEHGLVRQIASSTTFHIPDRGPKDPIWRRLFPHPSYGENLFEALAQERVALQEHAEKRGCRLIIDSVEKMNSVYKSHGLEGVRTRIELLRDFLQEAVHPVVAAINNDANRTGSITLVGDWFLSEAVSSSETRVLRQAVFTRDIRMVQRHLDDFEHQMHDLLAARGWTEADSRARAIEYLQGQLNQLTS